MTTRPNILFICADQLGAAQIGCYGSGVDSTPAIDSLSARGVRFDRFYARCPVCAPNRATILTGRSPSIHGVAWNNFLLPNDMPTYAHVLQRAGYATGGFGKFHQTPMWLRAPDTMAHLGFEESVVAEDPKWESWIDWVRERAPEHYQTALGMCWPGPRSQAGRSEQERRDYKQARDAAMRARRSGRWKMAYASPLPAELHDNAYITELGLDYIGRRAGADGTDGPFFCHVSYVDPHDPYDPPEPYASMFDPDEMPEPVPQAWSPQELPTLQNSTVWNDFETARDDPQAMREFRARFHGSLRFLDDQIARLIEASEQLDRPTVIIFATDHGEMLGDHGLITKAVKHYDAGIRCPLIMATINPDEPGGVAGAEGGAGAGRVDRALRSSLDLFPTFCDLAGVPDEERPPLEGRTFAPAVDSAPAGHEALCVEFDSVATIITDDSWRLTRYADDGVTQLFDLSSEPAEQHDRSADPECAARKTDMLEELTELLLQPHRVPQYRAMVELDGSRVAPNPKKGGGRGPAFADYELAPPPNLAETT